MHFLKQFVLVGIFCYFVDAAPATEWVDNPEVALPQGMIICKRNDPDRDACIKKSIQQIIPVIAGGYEPLGLDPIDPFFVPSINFNYRSGNLNVRMTAKNATAHGMINTKVKAVRSQIDDNKMHLEIDLFHPTLVMESMYKGEGNFNELRYKSKGYVNTTLSGVSASWKIDGVTETRNGEEYIKITKFDTKPKAKGVKIYATGIFPDPDLNHFALEFVNQYWEQLYEQLYPSTRQIWEPIVVNSMNKIFGRVPLRRLMPKD